MATDPKIVLSSHGVSQIQKLLALEFDQFPTLRAVEVVVLRVSVIVLVNSSSVELERAKKSGVDKFLESPIDGGTADVVRLAFPGKLIDQCIGIKVIMLAEDVLHQELALLGLPKTSALKIFFKAFFRRQCDRNSFKRGFSGIHVSKTFQRVSVFPSGLTNVQRPTASNLPWRPPVHCTCNVPLEHPYHANNGHTQNQPKLSSMRPKASSNRSGVS